MSGALVLSKKISKFIDLTENTDGGILFFNGAWGTGKTYFWKELTRKSDPKTVYVSLFGVRDVKDLKIKLTTALLIGDEKSILKKSLGTFFKNVGNIISGLSGVNLEVDVIDLMTTRKVICFDDLERVSSDCNIEEILGFVNHLAEHKDHRCVVILNDFEMHDDIKVKFFKLKEKLSFVTLEYRPDIMERVESFFNKKLPSCTVESKFVATCVSEAKLNNLRALRSIISRIEELKEFSSDEIPENVIKFLVAMVAIDTEGVPQEASFFKFSPTRFYLREADATPIQIQQKEFYEKYFGKNNSYRYFSSIFKLVREGMLDEKLYKEEVFGVASTQDVVSKYVEILKNTHYYFLTDLDLQLIQQNIQNYSSQNRIFHFNEVATFIRAYSSTIKLLEQPYPLVMPQNLELLAVDSIKTYEPLWELEQSFDHRNDDYIVPFVNHLIKIIKAEKLRRASVKYSLAIASCKYEDLKKAIEINAECLFGFVSSGDMDKVILSNSTVTEKDGFVRIVIEGLLRIRSNASALTELNNVHNNLTSKYTNLTSRTDRLRFYRLIEQTGLTTPMDKPTILC